MTVQAINSITLPLPMVTLHGVPLHPLTEAQTVELVLKRVDQKRGGWVVTANLDHLRRLVKEKAYNELCAPAELIVADGMPLVWASRLQRTPLPERVAGSSLIWTLTRAAASAGKSIFLLGGAPGTAERTAKVFASACPNLQIAGVHCPAVGFERDPLAVAAIADMLRSRQPDIVFVALGSPKQERLISEMRAIFPNNWWIGVGISFSFVCGEVKRAPKWMQRLGLEWCHRLMQEPRRLAYRYLVDDLPFVFSLFWSAFKNRRPFNRTP